MTTLPDDRTRPAERTTPAGVAYPPEPWVLEGRGDITVWRVPADRVPALPAGAEPVVVRGRALVATAFVDYAETGLLPYHELLAAVVVRHGRGLALSITDIWVDSEVSLAGGRGHWGIPKDLAVFSVGPRAGGTAWTCTVDGRLAARAEVRPGGPSLRLPVPLVTRVVQSIAGETVASKLVSGGRVRRARGTWEVPADGALGWLSGASALVTSSAADFSMTFGPRLSL